VSLPHIDKKKLHRQKNNPLSISDLQRKSVLKDIAKRHKGDAGNLRMMVSSTGSG